MLNRWRDNNGAQLASATRGKSQGATRNCLRQFSADAQSFCAVRRAMTPAIARSTGYLVPREDFSCAVHSVFTTACNLEWEATLLTVASPATGNGPTTVVLSDPSLDLRRLFVRGEIVRFQRSALRSQRTRVQLAHATTWFPPAQRAVLDAPHIGANVHRAEQSLLRARATNASVIDHEAAGVVAALLAACRSRDSSEACRLVARLIGWGEGLTPAGDDFLVGWLAALGRLGCCDRDLEFLAAVRRAILARIANTTQIAGHFLSLATQGHFVEAILCVLDALLCQQGREIAENAVERLLQIGATSGADLCTGLLGGIAAWMPVESNLTPS